MKMMENVAAAVILLIPTPRFFKELILSGGQMTAYIRSAVYGNFGIDYDWKQYVEFYNDEYKDFFYTFDNWEDLKNLTQKTSKELDCRNLKITLPLNAKIDQMKQLKIFVKSFNKLLSIIKED